MSFFRYPGGKTKLKKILISKLKEIREDNIEYREPFFGGGSVGLNVIQDIPVQRIWINDKNRAISLLWTSVIKYPEELKKHIWAFTPSVTAFYSFKEMLLSDKLSKIKYSDKVKTTIAGFMKIAIHQISYSGLGEQSGGPLGGKAQKSKYPIDCRWSPEHLCKKIDTYHNLLKTVDIITDSCTPMDFETVIRKPDPCFMYIDPPYIIKGDELYPQRMQREDHERLSLLLKESPHPWVVSYDDCSIARELYEWADIIDLSVTYSINGAYKKNEIIITNRKKVSIQVPAPEYFMPTPCEPKKTTITVDNYNEQAEIEGFLVRVKGDEYRTCDSASKNMWANSKKGNYGSGLLNTDSDPTKTERIGKLGEVAFAKILGVPVDMEYREFGDEFDFNISGITIDIKNAASNYGTGLVYKVSESGKEIPVTKDIYVFSYTMDVPSAERASVYFVGFCERKELLQSTVMESPRGTHFNYVVPYTELHPMTELINILRN